MDEKNKKGLGVPASKSKRSASASKSSPKKAPGFPATSSRASAPYIPMAGTCEVCHWWRDKGWASESSGIGICDNPKVDVRVTMGEHFMVNFCGMDPRNAKSVVNSIRYPNDFGCIFHKRASWVKTVRPLPAIGIGGAATKEPVRRTGAKRTTAKPGPKASPKQP